MVEHPRVLRGEAHHAHAALRKRHDTPGSEARVESNRRRRPGDQLGGDIRAVRVRAPSIVTPPVPRSSGTAASDERPGGSPTTPRGAARSVRSRHVTPACAAALPGESNRDDATRHPRATCVARARETRRAASCAVANPSNHGADELRIHAGREARAVLPRVHEHVDERIADRARRSELARVVLLAPESPARAERAIHGSRDADVRAPACLARAPRGSVASTTRCT